MAQKGVKGAKNTFKGDLDLHQIALKHSKSTQGPSRYTHLLHTFIGWYVDFDRFLSTIKTEWAGTGEREGTFEKG